MKHKIYIFVKLVVNLILLSCIISEVVLPEQKNSIETIVETTPGGANEAIDEINTNLRKKEHRKDTQEEHSFIIGNKTEVSETSTNNTISLSSVVEEKVDLEMEFLRKKEKKENKEKKDTKEHRHQHEHEDKRSLNESSSVITDTNQVSNSTLGTTTTEAQATFETSQISDNQDQNKPESHVSAIQNADISPLLTKLSDLSIEDKPSKETSLLSTNTRESLNTPSQSKCFDTCVDKCKSTYSSNTEIKSCAVNACLCDDSFTLPPSESSSSLFKFLLDCLIAISLISLVISQIVIAVMLTKSSSPPEAKASEPDSLCFDFELEEKSEQQLFESNYDLMTTEDFEEGGKCLRDF